MKDTTVAERRLLAARMLRVARRFRASHPLSPPRWAAGSFPLAMNFAGRPDTKVLAWFPSVGCVWSRSSGCTMCDFSENPNPGSIESAVAAFTNHLDELDAGTRHVHLGPGGSFFDDREVPPALRQGILQALRRLRFLHSVGIETRPNLMTRAKLMDLLSQLPDGVEHLTIGFGFECLDDLVREVTVNKGYGAREVERAVNIIADAKITQGRVRVEFEVYVLLKPLFLTEQEGIDEAVRTIDWSYAHGAETAALFMNTVKQNTVQGYLAGRDDLPTPIHYQPPYYRSAVQVLRTLPRWQRERTQVLGVQSGIVAQGMPRGCPLCTPFLLGALVAHNFTRDPAVLDKAATSVCPCRNAWLAELDAPAESLRTRVERGIAALERSYC